MSHTPQRNGNLRGSILAAHPSLTDPNFRRALIFIAEHSESEGAIGYVLNRPLAPPLEITHQNPPLSVPVYYGGPVQPEALVLASLQWRTKQNVVVFHLQKFDNEPEIAQEWRDGLRVFAGYAGWSRNQLEHEIHKNSWLVLAPNHHLIKTQNHTTIWQDVVRQAGPLFALLASAPDDPSLN